MKYTRQDKIDIIENALSWIVVFAMFVYGGAKIMQFDGATAIDKSVSELTGMQLMWAFYGYSKPYVIILGILEITGGLLILIKRTRLIGCFLTSTILVNVILQDIFFEVYFGVIKAAIIYQSMIIIIFFLNREKLIKILNILLDSNNIKQSKMIILSKLVIAFIFFIILRILEFVITNKF